MALLVTVFLVLINIFNTITTNSPNAEGLTAIEIWMLACILFVFGTYSVFDIYLGIFNKYNCIRYYLNEFSIHEDIFFRCEY